MAKDDGNTKSKKKDASSASLSGSIDASGLRRSGRETPSKKQATASPSSNARRFERIENQSSPSSSPIKKKQDKIEEQMGPSPLRRSDRSKKQLSPDSSGSKKLIEVTASQNIKSKKEKIASSSKEDAEDVSVVNKNERQDPDVGGRKRKRMTVRGYKALFKPQRLRIEAEDGQDSDVQHTPAESGRTTESGNGEKQIGGKCPQDNNGKTSTQNIDVDACEDNDNQISPKSPSSGCKKLGDDETSLACSKEQRINNDLKNQQELDSHDKTCDKDLQGTSTSKVRKTCQEAAVMENTENKNAKFVEFWVPVQISNLQLEQYCSTLLSGSIALRSGSKSDSVGVLHEILISNRKCCNHPYIADKDLQKSITKDQPSMIFDIGIKASGKLHFLDLILPDLKKRQLRVVILFQAAATERVTTESGIPVTIGDILDDFVHQRFGEDSYERVDGPRMAQKSKQAAFNNFNNNTNKFIFLLERASQPSIKLSSVDIIIIFDSDLNPANDIRKISIDSDSQQKQIMIFRLYSKNTLEEKILKLAEQNVPVDSKLSRLTCDALLMWGAKDLFKKLEKFHSKSGKDISSEEKLLKDVMEEFLYIVSNKCKIKDGEKSMITKVQTCGYYGNRNMPYGDIKNQLPDGEQPHIFWRNLLEGKHPRWKFVHVSTSRQRKRTQYYGDTPDTIAPVADAVKKRKKSPALKPAIEWGTGGANEGGNNDSQSSPELLKPTVDELCEILKFPEDVKNKVDRFLDFVLKNYNVSREDTPTLQAFMISLCWIGASLAKHKIDRRESFDLAKKQLNFDCKEEQANSVCLKLEEAKEDFLKQTETQEKHVEIKDLKSPPQAICTESTEQKMSTESQHDQNVEISIAENLESTEKVSEEMEEFNREWDDKRAYLENEYKVDKAFIRTLHKNPSIRSEKLRLLDKEFAKKIEEHERDKDIHLKELKSTLLAADVDADVAAEPETSVSVGNPGDKMTETPLELDGGRGSLGIGDDIESTCSHTSEKQMVDATVLSSSVVEIQPHQHENVDDVAAVVNEEIPAQEGDGIGNDVESVETDMNQENNSKGEGDGAEVADRVDDTGETGVPGGDEIRENGEDSATKHDESHAVEDQDQNDSCGSSSSNQPSAGVPQDDTPSVQLLASQPPDHPMPTILETENESLLEQLLDLGIQEKEAQADPNSLAQIISEEPHDDPMAENQTDTQPGNDVVLETTCENDRNAPDTVNDQQTVEQEEHNSTQNSEPPEITNQSSPHPEINLFDLPNQVAPRIPNHGDPLQAELERLFAYKDNVAKFYEDTKQRIKLECEKEIAEMIAQINLKYEAKFKEAETAFQSRKKELDTTVNRVVMNKILAEAFRAKCQDLTPSGPGMQKVSQAGLMQQLHRFSVRPSVALASSSPGQSSGRQQTPPPPPPPPPPPLQIVHQPAALFSNTVIRPPPPPPPPTINPVTPVTRPPPNITPNTRPPPTITPVTPTTATRPPPNITPVTPSAGSLRAPAPHLRPLVNSDIRAPAPHLRSFRPSTSASPESTPYRRMVPRQHVTSPPNSQPPLPPEASYVPPPPPPPAAAAASGGGAKYDLLDLTDIFPEDDENALPSSGHDLVCLSDDD